MLEKEFVKGLDTDLSWRRRDIASLFGLCGSKDLEVSSCAMRAIVAMMYAHWEGYIKKVSCDYARMLSSKRLRYSNLKLCFRGLAAVEHVNTLHDVKKRIFVASETLKKIESIENERVQIDLRSKIDRIGNLDFAMFIQIISFIGISPAPYGTKRIFIDERLLSRRNKIAHGAYTTIDLAGIAELRENVVELLELFRNDMQNAISTKSYMV